MKFVVFVEGATERKSASDVLERWLTPRLNTPVGIQIVRFNGWADLVKSMELKARLFLRGPQASDIIAVIALLDLYGPDIFPPDKKTAEDRYAWAKKHFENKVGIKQFRLFFAVHEYEAWLLSQPSIFSPAVQKALPGKIAKPEDVNFDEPPAMLLDRVFKQAEKRGYKKTVDGCRYFAKLDPQVAEAKCPYLKNLLHELLSLAKAAGQ